MWWWEMAAEPRGVVAVNGCCLRPVMVVVLSVGMATSSGGGCDGSEEGDGGGHWFEMVARWGLRWCVVVKRMVDRSGGVAWR
ncbi:hypothetical protein Tco_1345588 [Tanacetum coccineum]